MRSRPGPSQRCTMYTSPMNIVYAAHDQTIRVHDLAEPDVSDRVLSVPGLRCTWPLVSPGGDLVAFSGYAGGSNGSAHLGLYATGIDSRGPGLIYANEPGSDGIARGTPHYSCWSPDGSKLAFIAQTARGLTLFVWDADSGESPRALLDGGPMYFSWSNTSAELFVHSFTGHYLVDVSSDEGDARPRAVPGSEHAVHVAVLGQDQATDRLLPRRGAEATASGHNRPRGSGGQGPDRNIRYRLLSLAAPLISAWDRPDDDRIVRVLLRAARHRL